MPDLDTLISNSIATTSGQKLFTTPDRSRENPRSQSFSGSDGSVERHLTQSADMDFDSSFDDGIMRANGLGNPENLYAGELNWTDDEHSQNRPRSRSRSPTPSQSSQSQSQSQSESQLQPTSPPFPIDTTPPRSPNLPIQIRQSWYQTPGRVSRPKRTHHPPSPASILTRQNDASASSNASPEAQHGAPTPTKTYLSGSLKIQSPAGRPNQPHDGTLNPSDIMSQPQTAYQSASQMSTFFPQTQAPYRSQSTSQ